MARPKITVADKILDDVTECVVSLKLSFEEDGYPVTDDNLTFQKFCAKLEFLLQHNLKDKRNVLGTRKSYWDYLCQCLSTSRKTTHDGVRFVKLKSELKTSQGKGRGLVRFCLSHGCLADSLQKCFIQRDLTRDWYEENAIPCVAHKWNSLVSTLYDLNDVNFDLSPECHELDVSWPTFARKQQFDGGRFNWRPPSRSLSVSSLASQSESMNTSIYETDTSKDSIIAEEDIEEVRNKNIELEKRELELEQEIEQLKRSKDLVDSFSGVMVNGIDKVTEEYATKVELLILQHSSRERYFEESERVSSDALMALELKVEETRLALEAKVEECVSLKQTVTMRESTNDTLEVDIENLRGQVEGLSLELKQSVDDNSKLTEANLNLSLSLDRSQSESKLLEQDIRDKTLSLEQSQEHYSQACDTNSHLQSVQDTLEVNLKSAKDRVLELESVVLQKEIKIVEDSLQMDNYKATIQTLQAVQENVSDDDLVLKIADLESLNGRLHEDIKLLANSLQGRVESLESEKNGLSTLVDKLELSRSILAQDMAFKDTRIEELNEKLAVFDRYGVLLMPLISQQDKLINQFDHSVDILQAASHKLQQDMKSLAIVLQRLAQYSKMDLEFKSLDSVCNIRTKVDDNQSQEHDVDYDGFPLAHQSHNLLSKLQTIMAKKDTIDQMVLFCQCLCQDMTSFAVEKEDKLMSKRLKLAQTQHVVETLAKEHKKVAAAEAILKYELKEKRKLLTRLREQLESTRQDWNKVRLRNAESELEWQSLRDGFAKRYKQPSEESGFVDEKQTEEVDSDQAASTSVLEPVPEELIAVPEELIVEEIVPVVECSSSSTSCSLPSTPVEPEVAADVPEPEVRPRRRLEILEEQCNLLYYSLLHSSKKSELLEQRLQAILGTTEDNSSVSSRTDPPAQTTSTAASRCSTSEEGLMVEDEEVDGPVFEFTSVAVAQEFIEMTDNEGIEELEQIDSEPDSLELQFDNGCELNVVGSSCNSTRKKALEGFVAKLKNERVVREAVEADFKAKIQCLEDENATLTGKIAELELENTNVSLKGSDFRKRAEFIFRKERDSFDSKLQSAATERTQLLSKQCELEKELDSNTEQLRGVREELDECQRLKEEVETALKQEIASLKFQLSTEALKYERALQHYSGQERGIVEMKEKISHQEQIIASLEEALREIREERVAEMEKQNIQLEDLEISLSTRDEECVSMNDELKRLTQELDENKNFLSEVKCQSQNVEVFYRGQLDQLTAELTELHNDNEELKAQLIKLTRDKDTLWKKSEHLSRMSASSGPSGGWMADHSTTQCLECSAIFSFTLRKHHCRLCGRIFCHNCAGHWVLTASSSRRSRVCNECYGQHVEGGDNVWKQPIRRGNEEQATEVTVDEEDGASVDSMPVFNASNTTSNDEIDRKEEEPASSDNSGLDFDVISDEEIARSLSASSPYSPTPDMNQSIENEMHCSETRTVVDIENAGEDGLKGEVWINAGSTYTVPIIIDNCGTSLLWEFTTESKSIAFSVAYKESDMCNVLLNTTRVQSHLRPVQGHLVAKHSGCYLLIFDNHFSKFTAKKVTYSLRIGSSSTANKQ